MHIMTPFVFENNLQQQQLYGKTDELIGFLIHCRGFLFTVFVPYFLLVEMTLHIEQHSVNKII